MGKGKDKLWPDTSICCKVAGEYIRHAPNGAQNQSNLGPRSYQAKPMTDGKRTVSATCIPGDTCVGILSASCKV